MNLATLGCWRYYHILNVGVLVYICSMPYVQVFCAICTSVLCHLYKPFMSSVQVFYVICSSVLCHLYKCFMTSAQVFYDICSSVLYFDVLRQICQLRSVADHCLDYRSHYQTDTSVGAVLLFVICCCLCAK